MYCSHYISDICAHYYKSYINKYMELIPSKPTTISVRIKGIDNYVDAQTTICTQYTNNNVVTIESSRKREHEHSILRTFVRLFV